MAQVRKKAKAEIGVEMIDFIGHLRVDFLAAKSHYAAKDAMQKMVDVLAGVGVKAEFAGVEAVRFLNSELPE